MARPLNSDGKSHADVPRDMVARAEVAAERCNRDRSDYLELAMVRPLEGIRVIELANFIAGPFCGMLLADMGADVVKIEPPARGDMTRSTPPLVGGESAGFMAINRNKRSVALDLKRPEAVEIA